MPLPVLLPLLVLLASLPALYAWWRGRRIRAMPDDQLLPERLVEERKRSSYLVAAAYVVITLIGGWHLFWTIPLTLVLLMAADYPARKQIYGETWSLTQYLWFWTRLAVAFSGFWVVLGLTPFIAHLGGRRSLAVGALAGVALVLVNARFDRLFLALLRAKPLDDPSLKEAFGRIVERASVPQPRVWLADEGGGTVPTALALPGSPGSVLFFRSLVERLSTIETVAVFAHEVAHLEQYTPRVLRNINLVTLALIAVAATLPTLVAAVAPGSVMLAVALWPVFVVGLMVLRTRLHKPLELDGDRRAAVLCGDVEAVASALIRLHALARMPRRLDQEVERWASHPSLARRIQALRALGEPPAAAVARAPVTFATSSPEAVVTFDAEGLRIGSPAEGTGTVGIAQGTSALTRYGDLHELRLELKSGRRPHLVARERAGRVIRIAVREEDAAAIQRALDEVDGLLAPTGPGAALQPAGILAACASLVGLFWISVLAIFAAAAVAVFRPSAPTLSAASAAAISGGGIVWWSSGQAVHPAALVLIGLGIAIAAVAFRARRLELDTPERLVAGGALLVLGLGTLITWGAGVLLPGLTALRLHRALAMTPGVAVFPLSLAALLIAYANGRSRPVTVAHRISSLFAVSLTMLGILPVAAAAPFFLERTVRDPLVASAPRFGIVDATIEVEHTFRLKGVADAVRLSPGGGWISVATYEEDPESENMPFALLARNGRRLQIDAAEIAFVDDEQVAVIVRDDNGLVLSVRRLESGLPVAWSERLPHLFVGRLDVSSRRRTWRATGWSENGDPVRLAGAIGEAGHEERRWSSPDAERTQRVWFVASGDTAVRLEAFDQPSLASLFAQGPGLGHLAQGYRHLAWADGSGVHPVATELKANCVDPPDGDVSVTCAAFDGVDSRVFRVGDGITPVANLRGGLWLREQDADGTLLGVLDGDHVLVQAGARRVVRLANEDDGWSDVTYAAGRAARTSIADGDRSIVEVGRVVVR